MDAPATPARPRALFDPARIAAAARRHRWLIAGTLAVALALGLLATVLATPRYVASASLQIDQQAERVVDAPSLQADAAGSNEERFLQTQVDVLRSRATAGRVARALNLANDPAALAALGVPTPPATPADRTEAAVGALLAGLSVDLPRNSRVVTLSIESTDARLSATVANRYARTFIEANLQRGFDSSAYARDFLSRQLVETKARLEESERELNGYARSAGLLSAPARASGGSGGGEEGGGDGPALASVTFDSLAQLNRAANDARAERIAAEQRWRAARNTPAQALPQVQANAAIQGLLGERARLSAALAEERVAHRDDHPAVREKLAQLSTLERQIAELAGDVKSSVRDQYTAAVASEAALAGQVARLTGDAQSEQDRSVRYNILAREVETNRQLYDSLLGRFKELSAAAGVTTNNIAPVDTAEPPALPSSPSLALNLAVALLLGAVAAAALVVWREQTDDAVRLPADVERKLELPALAAIPAPAGGEDPVALLDQPRSPIAEAFGALRGTLLYATADGLPRSLLVTSAQPREGKSTTSWALASSVARLGRRVLLIDGDLRKPAVHGKAGLANGAGTSDLLVGARAVDEVVHRDVAGGGGGTLDVVTAGPIPPNPTDLLGSGRLLELLAELEAGWDFVVIDGPPVLGLADAPTLGAHAAATLFVVEAGRSGRGSTKTALRRLRAAGATLVGAVLTKFDAKRAGAVEYGYDYYSYGTTGAAE